VSVKSLSRRIADNQKTSYSIAFLFGMVLFVILLFLNDWNLLSIVAGDFSIELSIFTGVFMRFIGGLGITLTYTTFCAFVFSILASSLKGRKMVARLIFIFIILATLIIILYAFTKIGIATSPLEELSFLDLPLTISGVWSLVLLVYIVPLVKDEYRPKIGQKTTTKAKETIVNWTSSVLKSYRTHISRDYGRVYESEFQRYRARMLDIRVILSGLLLFPIALSLILITPIAAVTLILWIRMFSLNYKQLAGFERGLLILVTLLVGSLTTYIVLQSGLSGLRVIFDASYGFGLLSGIILLFLIIL
jgi:hypothetical protein